MKKSTKWIPSLIIEKEDEDINTMSNGRDTRSLKHCGNPNKPFPMTETCCHFINNDTNSEPSKKMKSILKQTSMDSITSSITFYNYCDERIQIMKNSTDEYARFLTQLDNLITRIDLTMETMRLPFKRKTVRFAEHNKILLIPP